MLSVKGKYSLPCGMGRKHEYDKIVPEKAPERDLWWGHTQAYKLEK
jgi:hypothetical protein